MAIKTDLVQVLKALSLHGNASVAAQRPHSRTQVVELFSLHEEASVASIRPSRFS